MKRNAILFVLLVTTLLSCKSQTALNSSCAAGILESESKGAQVPELLIRDINQACSDFKAKTGATEVEVQEALKGARFTFVSKANRKLCLPIGTDACAESKTRHVEVYTPAWQLTGNLVKHETVHLLLYAKPLHKEHNCTQHEWMAEHGMCYLACDLSASCP